MDFFRDDQPLVRFLMTSQWYSFMCFTQGHLKSEVRLAKKRSKWIEFLNIHTWLLSTKKQELHLMRKSESINQINRWSRCHDIIMIVIILWLMSRWLWVIKGICPYHVVAWSRDVFIKRKKWPLGWQSGRFTKTLQPGVHGDINVVLLEQTAFCFYSS